MNIKEQEQEEIYYAHHLYKYNTKIEEYELNIIKKELPGFKILNPNGDIIHEDLNDEEKIMAKCLNIVGQCDSLAFSSLNGVVGKGVFDEVNHALSLGKKVYYIQNNTLQESSHIKFNVINESGRIFAIVKQI